MNRGLVDYNFTVVRSAVNKTFEVRTMYEMELEELEEEEKRAAAVAAAAGDNRQLVV